LAAGWAHFIHALAGVIRDVRVAHITVSLIQQKKLGVVVLNMDERFIFRLLLFLRHTVGVPFANFSFIGLGSTNFLMIVVLVVHVIVYHLISVGTLKTL
jgi:hypothetical protein